MYTFEYIFMVYTRNNMDHFTPNLLEKYMPKEIGEEHRPQP